MSANVTGGGAGLMKKYCWQDIAWLGWLLGTSLLGVDVQAFTTGGPRTPQSKTSSHQPVLTTTTITPASTTPNCGRLRSTKLYSARTGKSSRKGGADEEPVDPKAADTLPGYDSWLESRKDEIDVSILYDEEVRHDSGAFIDLLW